MLVHPALFGVLVLLLVIGLIVQAVEMSELCPHGPACPLCRQRK